MHSITSLLFLLSVSVAQAANANIPDNSSLLRRAGQLRIPGTLPDSVTLGSGTMSCPVGAIQCSSNYCCKHECCGAACCPFGSTCVSVGAKVGCCAVGDACDTVSRTCISPGYVQCGIDNFCCPSGTASCSLDAAGIGHCRNSTGTDSGSNSGASSASVAAATNSGGSGNTANSRQLKRSTLRCFGFAGLMTTLAMLRTL